MKADLISAYAASLARVASWAVVTGLIYRLSGAEAFAAFSMLRAIITIVAVTGLGLTPALTILLPQFRLRVVDVHSDHSPTIDTKLNYFTPRQQRSTTTPDQQLLNTALMLVFLAGIGMLVVGASAGSLLDQKVEQTRFWRIFIEALPIAILATVVRVFADTAGSRLQTTGWMTLDFILQAATEISWVGLCLLVLPYGNITAEKIQNALELFLLSNSVFALVRVLVAVSDQRILATEIFKLRYANLLIKTGSILMLAQFADLLYGPANQAIIKGLLSSIDLATYAPLLHIDAALLLGVGGLATLLLPKTAIAMGEKNAAAVCRYYINGTLASIVLLAAGGTAACAFAPKLFQLWFNDPLPATVALLPLVMVHTVIGGSAGVGRSILFGLNRAKAYTAAALIGGVANVGLAILLVTYTSLGLKAIVLATIITVTLRCGIWMPWYILKTLRDESARFAAEDAALASTPAMP